MTARVPQGVPTGGQFATAMRTEPTVILTGNFAPADQDSLEDRLGHALGERHKTANVVAELSLAQLVDRTRSQFPAAKAVRLETCYDTDGMELAGVVDGDGNILAGNDYDSSPAQRAAYSEWVNQATGTQFNAAGLAQQLPQHDASWWDHTEEVELDVPDRAQWDVNLGGSFDMENLDERLTEAIQQRRRSVDRVADLALSQVAQRTRLQFPTAQTVRLEVCHDSDGMELSEVLDGNGHVLASAERGASTEQRSAFSEWVSQGTGTRHNLSGLAQQLDQGDSPWWNYAEEAELDDPDITKWDVDLDSVGAGRKDLT